MDRFSVAFLLEETSISGLASLVLTHADALVDRGHEVTIFTPDAPVDWRSSLANWRYVSDLSEAGGTADIAVATSSASLMATVGERSSAAAVLLYARAPGDEERRAVRRAFDSIGRSFRHITASGSAAQAAGQPDAMIVDSTLFNVSRRSLSTKPRVLITGACDEAGNAIDAAYGAVAHARWHGDEFELVRISRWAPAASEPADQYADELYVAITAADVVRVVTSCDLFVSAASRERGLRVSVAETLAAGLTPVMPGDARRHDDDDGDPAVVLGERLRSLLHDEEQRLELSQKARTLARAYHFDDAGMRFEAFLYDALNERR